MSDQKYLPIAVVLGSHQRQGPLYGHENSTAIRALQQLTDVLIVRITESKESLPDRIAHRLASLVGREYSPEHAVFTATQTSLRAHSQVAELPGVAALVSFAPPFETIFASQKIPVIQVADPSFENPLHSGHSVESIGVTSTIQGKILERIAALGTSAFAVANQRIKNILLEDVKVPEEKIAVLPMGSCLSDITVRPARTTDRDLIKLLFVCRDWEYDGFKEVLTIFERLVQHRRAQLCIIGDVPKVPLPYGAEVIPSEQATELADYYSRYDVLMVPRVNGQDAMVIDALTCGLPVIAEHSHSLESLVHHGHTGWLYSAREFTQSAYERLLYLKAVDIDLASDRAARDAQEWMNWDGWARGILQLVHHLNGQPLHDDTENSTAQLQASYH